MKLIDKMREIIDLDENLIEKYLSYNILGSFLNILEDSIGEIDDKEINTKFNEFQELVMKKREELADTEITALTGKDSRGEKQ